MNDSPLPDIQLLKGPKVDPTNGEPPKKIIILLHGLGSDGDDLIGLVPQLSPFFPDAVFISPNAPFPCDMAPFGYQWFSLMDRRPEALLSGARTAAPILNHFIDIQLQETNLDESNLAFIAFSQGTMISLHTVLRRKKPCAGILGYSGALVAPELLSDEVKNSTPVCLIHGNMDDVVPFEAMEQAKYALSSSGINIRTHTCQGLGHGISPEGLQYGIQFLKECFNL